MTRATLCSGFCGVVKTLRISLAIPLHFVLKSILNLRKSCQFELACLASILPMSRNQCASEGCAQAPVSDGFCTQHSPAMQHPGIKTTDELRMWPMHDRCMTLISRPPARWMGDGCCRGEMQKQNIMCTDVCVLQLQECVRQSCD